MSNTTLDVLLRGYIDLMFPLLCAAPRMMGMLLGFDVLPGPAFPPMLRNTVAIALSLLAVPAAAADSSLRDATYLMMAALLLKEVLLGFLLGYVLGLPIAVFESVGTIIDTQTGTNNASIFDPQSGHEGGPSAGLLRQIAITALVGSGVFHAGLALVYASYRVWPIGMVFPSSASIAQSFAMGITGRYWELILIVGAPVVLALLLIEGAMGIINRSLSQLDVSSVAMPIKGVIALLVLSVELVIVGEQLVRYLAFPVPVVTEALETKS